MNPFHKIRKLVALLLSVTMLATPAYPATPNQANINNLSFTGVDSTTGNAAAPFVDHSTGSLAVSGVVSISVSGVPVAASAPFPVQQTATPTAPPYLQLEAIATGAYPGKTPFSVDGRAFGVNNTRVDVIEFATSYVAPASPIQMQVVSTSANDAALGSGVRSVVIHYLDTNYNVQSTTVTLNGVTPVLTTPTNILRVNGMHAFTTAGFSAAAAGNISLQSVGGATTYAYISTGYRTSRSAVFTIPAGKTGYIYAWGMSAGAVTGSHFTSAQLLATAHEGVALPGVPILQHEVGELNNGIEFLLPIPVKIPATMDIRVSAISDASNANVTVTTNFDGWYE